MFNLAFDNTILSLTTSNEFPLRNQHFSNFMIFFFCDFLEFSDKSLIISENTEYIFITIFSSILYILQLRSPKII